MKHLTIRQFFLLLIVATIVAGVATNAFADKRSGDRITQSNDNNTQTAGDIDVAASASAVLSGGDMVGGDTSLSSTTKNLAIAAPNLGDVDIAQCLGSTQWSLLVGGKQKLVLNQVCMAEFYLKAGRYDLAAQALCNQPEIIAEYNTESDCELAHDFTPITVYRSEEPAANYEPEVNHEEDMEIVQIQQAGLVAQLDYVTEQLEEVRNKPSPEPVIVQQQVEYTDEQFDAVFMALKGSNDDE